MCVNERDIVCVCVIDTNKSIRERDTECVCVCVCVNVCVSVCEREIVCEIVR